MSSGNKYWKKPKSFEMLVHRGHIVSAIEVYLRSLGVIKDREDVVDIEFTKPFGKETEELITIKIHYKGGSQTESDQKEGL